MIDYLIRDSSKLFVIDGKNQLLYRSSSCDYLTQALPATIPPENQREKRRVYRNTSETFLLAQLFVQSYPSPEKAQRIWTQTLQKRYRASRKTAEQAQFDFELLRENGGAPSVSDIADRPSNQISLQIAQSLKSKIQQLRLTNDGTPSDILILVPYGKADSSWRSIAINACQSAGYDYIDYTDEEIDVPRIRQMRFVSAPSTARGELKDSIRSFSDSINSIPRRSSRTRQQPILDISA